MVYYIPLGHIFAYLLMNLNPFDKFSGFLHWIPHILPLQAKHEKEKPFHFAQINQTEKIVWKGVWK